MIMDRVDASGAWCWKFLPTRALMFEKHKSAPGHKSSEDFLMVMCCGNASRNHKLEFVVPGKAKKKKKSQEYLSELHSCPLLKPERSMDGYGDF
jgi:hypothetical protein